MMIKHERQGARTEKVARELRRCLDELFILCEAQDVVTLRERHGSGDECGVPQHRQYVADAGAFGMGVLLRGGDEVGRLSGATGRNAG